MVLVSSYLGYAGNGRDDYMIGSRMCGVCTGGQWWGDMGGGGGCGGGRFMWVVGARVWAASRH